MAGIFPQTKAPACHLISNQALAAIFYQTKPWLPFSIELSLGCHSLLKQASASMADIFCQTRPKPWLTFSIKPKPLYHTWLPFPVKPIFLLTYYVTPCLGYHLVSNQALADIFCQTNY